MIEKMNNVSRFFYRPDVGLLVIRITLGVIFIHHGWGKFQNESMTMSFMAHIGLPEFMAYVITTVEILGGLMLICGVLTRVAGVALLIAMIVAVGLVTFPGKGLAGSEFEILLGIASLGIAFAGAGKYRLSHIFEHDRHTEGAGA